MSVYIIGDTYIGRQKVALETKSQILAIAFPSGGKRMYKKGTIGAEFEKFMVEKGYAEWFEGKLVYKHILQEGQKEAIPRTVVGELSNIGFILSFLGERYILKIRNEYSQTPGEWQALIYKKAYINSAGAECKYFGGSNFHDIANVQGKTLSECLEQILSMEVE